MGLVHLLCMFLFFTALPFLYLGYPIWMPVLRLVSYFQGNSGDPGTRIAIAALVAAGAFLSCCCMVVFLRSLWAGGPTFRSMTIRGIGKSKTLAHERRWYDVKFLTDDDRLEEFRVLRVGARLTEKIGYKMKIGFSGDFLVYENMVYAVGIGDEMHYFPEDLAWKAGWPARLLNVVFLVMCAYTVAGAVAVGAMAQFIEFYEPGAMILVGWFTILWIGTFVAWAILKHRRWLRRCRQAAEAIGEYRTAPR